MTDKIEFTTEKIAELRALAEKATPLPWFANVFDLIVEINTTGKSVKGKAIVGWNGFDSSGFVPSEDKLNARYIVAAANALPAALEEIERLQARIETGDELTQARDRIETLEMALTELSNWAKAYPLDVFPEPDFRRVRELLEAGGITIDSVSASIMRRLIERVGIIVNKALEAK